MPIYLGTINILRGHILKIFFTPIFPYVRTFSLVLSTESKQNLTHPSPLQVRAYVIYEWSPS